ncbi:D-2-hydroxyacid dehydrogenase family protein [Spiractinospora alimapuensis]|uniref:D-2-hydroxyacid dehydrogenase family protein n=1 Tax=Spiractinospora alimapuensis TaxID=2820884 RepID=UPI001F16B3AA|nr:D-2-hydroxyacid dehydrogenase family protein [Spiractinospora alimapuensis]QVQ53710.1 D-2-hydroxyacid dehydrogenase family protein [Spiractinospora alimapuensis]
MAHITSVAVLDDYQDISREFGDWTRLGDRVRLTVFNDHLSDVDALADRLEPFEVVCAMRERTTFDADLLRRLPRLRLLVTTGMRNPAIDMDAARELGVTVCGTASPPTHTVELTWALILSLLRRVPAEDASIRGGGWQHTVGADLHGRTLGVLGLGRLGSRVARIGEAFGMRVLAWSANLTDERAAEHGARRVTFPELLAESDVATIHLRLNDGTRGLIGARELDLIGSGGYLVNTSRGPIVQERPLVTALHDGTIAGAALDVYDVEPLPVEHPLRSTPNTVLTPHIGYGTAGTYRTFFTETVADIEAFLDGEPIRVVT